MKHINGLRKFCNIQHALSLRYPYPDFFDTRTHGFHGLPIDRNMALLHSAQLVAGFFFGLLTEIFHHIKTVAKPAQGFLLNSDHAWNFILIPV